MPIISLLCVYKHEYPCLFYSSVNKLQITRFPQPLYLFKSSHAHLKRCYFWSSVSQWGTHQVQTLFLGGGGQNCLPTAPDIPVQLVISFNNHTFCSFTTFAIATNFLLSKGLGLPELVLSFSCNFSALQLLFHLQLCALKRPEVHFESISNLMWYLIWL